MKPSVPLLAAIAVGAILLQVFVPAILDIAVAVVVGGAAFMLGRATRL